MDAFEGDTTPSAGFQLAANKFGDYHAVISTLYSILSPVIYPTLRLLDWARSIIFPLALPLLNQLSQLAQESPAVVSLGVLLLTLYISLRIMGFLQRMVAFGARLVFGLVFYGAIVVVAMLVYQRGVDRTASDVAGWAQEIQRVWMREYGRWEQMQNQASGAKGSGNMRPRWS
jgi:hypothetical protein